MVEMGVSAIIGAIDNVLVELEERGIITGNMTYIKDAVRIGGAIGGLLLNYFVAKPGTTADRVTKALAFSSLPLAIHSIRNLVTKYLMYPATRYELVEVPRAPAYVPSYAPAPVPVSAIRSY